MIVRAVFWGSLGALALDARGLSARDGRACAHAAAAGSQGGADAVCCARRLRAQRGGGDRPPRRERCSRSTIRPRGSRSSSPPTARRTSPTPSSARSPPRTARVGFSSARARARWQRSIERSARPRARCSRSPTRTASGSPTRCARSSATSPTPRSGTSAGSSGSRARTARTWRASTGATRCGCASRSRRASSITAGNGAIYAVKRDAYVEDDPRFGHDFGFPYLMEQMGLRAVYEPEAVAIEKPAAEPEDEYGRKVRTISRAARAHPHRSGVPADCGRSTSRSSSRTECSATRPGSCTSGCSSRTSCSSRARPSIACSSPPARRARARGAGKARLPVPARGSPTTTTSSRRRRSRRSCATCGRGTPQTWDKAQGHAMNRAADVAIAGVGLALTSPLIGLAALATKLEDRGPVLYRQTRVGKDGEDFEVLKLRTMVVGAETHGSRLRGGPGRPAHHARRAHPPADVDRRAPAALEHPARRHERHRPAADAALPGRAVRRAPAPPARHQARAHRVGAGARPGRAALGGAHRARRLVRREPLAACRPRDPPADTARALPRDVPRRDRRLAPARGVR